MSDSANNDPIANALNIVPLVPKQAIVAVKNQNEYETAKENMLNLIDLGTTAISELSEMASVSQDGRVYRVLSELLANLIVANKELVAIKQMNFEMEQKERTEGQPTTVNQNLILSTKDVLELLREKKNEE